MMTQSDVAAAWLAKLAFLCFMFCLGTSCAYGSSVVFVVSKTGDYVVIAADSRSLKATGDNNRSLEMKTMNPVHGNSECKIIALDGDTLFYETGTAYIGVHRGKPWSSLAIARSVYKSSTKHDAMSLSVAWGNRALEWFYGQSANDIGSVTDSEEGLTNGGFINFDERSEPSAHGQTLYYDSSKRQLSRKPTVQSLGQIGAAGVGRGLVSELVSGKTTRARAALGAIPVDKLTTSLVIDTQFVTKAVQFVIDNATGREKESVRGPIDVAVIRRFGGVDWVRRKNECRAADLVLH